MMNELITGVGMKAIRKIFGMKEATAKKEAQEKQMTHAEKLSRELKLLSIYLGDSECLGTDPLYPVMLEPLIRSAHHELLDFYIEYTWPSNLHSRYCGTVHVSGVKIITESLRYDNLIKLTEAVSGMREQLSRDTVMHNKESRIAKERISDKHNKLVAGL